MGKKKVEPNPAQSILTEAQNRYQTTLQPSANENAMAGLSQQFQQQYTDASARQTADYGNIMSAYNDFRKGLKPTSFKISRA